MVSDEKLFGEATREFSSSMVDADLLAKARVLAGGDEKALKSNILNYALNN